MYRPCLLYTSKISAERIRVELNKLLISKRPEYMEAVYEAGITKIVLPEFDELMKTCLLYTSEPRVRHGKPPSAGKDRLPERNGDDWGENICSARQELSDDRPGASEMCIRDSINPTVMVGWSSTICAIVVFSGLILMVLGIIGEYLGKMILILNRTPQYIVRETINVSDEEEKK